MVLRNHSCRISVNQGNNRIPERNFSEGPVLMVHRKPQALTQTNN